MSVLTYSSATAITTSDTATQRPMAGIYVGGAGNVAVVMAGDPTNTVITFTAPPVGTILPINARLVKATGTTATLLIALR